MQCIRYTYYVTHTIYTWCWPVVVAFTVSNVHSTPLMTYIVWRTLLWRTLFDVHCMTYIVWRTLYDVHYLTYIVWRTLYDVHCLTYIVWRILYEVDCTTYIIWRTLYNIHCMTYIWQHTIYDQRCQYPTYISYHSNDGQRVFWYDVLCMS